MNDQFSRSHIMKRHWSCCCECSVVTRNRSNTKEVLNRIAKLFRSCHQREKKSNNIHVIYRKVNGSLFDSDEIFHNFVSPLSEWDEWNPKMTFSENIPKITPISWSIWLFCNFQLLFLNDGPSWWLCEYLQTVVTVSS